MARRRARPEQQIQKALVQHLKARAWPDVAWWSTPNGGWRTPVEGAILKATGVQPGFPDMCFLLAGKLYALELKAEGGRPTENQLAWLDRINKAGGFACIAEGLDRAIACLETWGILKGKSA